MRSTVLLALVTVGAVGYGQTTLSLDRALILARQNRPAVQAAQHRVTSAQFSRRALGAFPATRLFLGYSSPPEVGGSDDDAVLAQSLDVFGRTGAARSVGDAQVLRAEAEYRQVLADIQANVIELYSEAASARQLATSANSRREIAERLQSATEQRVKEGIMAGVQLTRLTIEVERARLDAAQRSTELESTLQRLAGALHVQRSDVQVTDFPALSADFVDAASLQGQRADLLLLLSEVRAAEADARVARVSSLPELEIQARKTPWQERDTRFGARIQLSIPLFDFGRARNETKAAQARAEAAKKALADATRVAEGELEAAHVEVSAATAQLTRYAQIVATARDLVERSRIGFNEGAITLIEILEATRALREVEESQVEARLRLAQAQTRYLRASGRLLQVNP